MAVGRMQGLADELPKNVEAERSILGAVILDNSALERATKIIRTEDFSRAEYRCVFDQMIALAANRQPIELLTLNDELEKHGRMEAAGGIGVVSALADGMPRVNNVEHYARIVREKALRRGLIYRADEIQTTAYGSEPVESVMEHAAATFRDYVNTAKIRPQAWRDQFKTHDQMEQGDLRFLINDFLPEGICFLGALSGSGKTWFALSMAKALTTGQNFLGLHRFAVPAPVNVVYLVPEAGECSFRARMDRLGISDRFFCQTMRDGLPIKLDSPVLMAAVRDLNPVIFLDTAIRFVTVESENSATENANGLASGLFALLNTGAQGIVGLHHRPKSAAEQEMTLENVLRGTGDLGAMCDVVYGLRVADHDKLEVKVQCVKARDIDPVPPFHIQGRPYINTIGDFGVIFDPRDATAAAPKEPSEVEKLRAATRAHPTASYRDLEEITGIARSRISRVAKQGGMKKVGLDWTDTKLQSDLVN